MGEIERAREIERQKTNLGGGDEIEDREKTNLGGGEGIKR